MTFNTEKITFEDSIRYGRDDAPIKVVEFINLRCPDSLAYEKSIASLLEDYVKSGRVQRIIKHFDKEKPGLVKGNLLNTYIDYSQQEEAFRLVKGFFTSQGEWGNESLEAVGEIAKKHGLKQQPDHEERSERVMAEIKAVGVERIPTVFIGNEAFVENIDAVRFHKVISSKIGEYGH